MKRAIQRKVENPLGRLIVKGEVAEGQRLLVEVNADRDALVFRLSEPEVTPSVEVVGQPC